MSTKSANDWLEEGEYLRSQGREADALVAFKQAAEVARSTFEPAVEARAWLAVGELSLLQDDFKGARAALEDAIGRAVEGGALETEADAWFALATASFDRGLSKDGHDALLEAMALSRQLADASPQDVALKARLARTIRVYGEHLGVLGSEADARQALELAGIMYADIGDQSAAQDVREELALLHDYAR